MHSSGTCNVCLAFFYSNTFVPVAFLTYFIIFFFLWTLTEWDCFCLFKGHFKKVKIGQALKWLFCKGSQAKVVCLFACLFSFSIYRDTLAFDFLLFLKLRVSNQQKSPNDPSDSWNGQWYCQKWLLHSWVQRDACKQARKWDFFAYLGAVVQTYAPEVFTEQFFLSDTADAHL